MNKKADSSQVKSPPRGRSAPSSPAAKARLAAALRENLQRRKAQARGQEDQQTKTVPSEDDPG